MADPAMTLPQPLHAEISAVLLILEKVSLTELHRLAKTAPTVESAVVALAVIDRLADARLLCRALQGDAACQVRAERLLAAEPTADDVEAAP